MTDISTAIVTRNRPFFLRDCLKSLEGMKLNITVFYRGDDPKYEEAYLQQAEAFKDVKFVKQADGMSDYMRSWLKEANDYIFIGVDDNICKGPFDVKAVLDFMENHREVFAFNLGADPNTKRCPDMEGSIGEYESWGDIVVYHPSTSTGMWGQKYVWAVSTFIHRKKDVERAWNFQDFNIVNQLEIGGRHVVPNVEKMACFAYAPLTNIHVESVWECNLVGIIKRVTDIEAFNLMKDSEIDVQMTFEERDRLNTTNVMELYLKPIT